ncbi:hypothetical protein THASP1DRAFT_27965 [Thamnocephalis sphaerospora]|uniref:Myb-like domain-containing protein n=1 Tax=Thamnocephalis sphaerospora TaxID=78915 RepID=A0A4P9XVD7_9FUNG|nr:hypothetical protein THASP1DRAFT_27965 [Thamnocephalis sphaerospora]|eukprot:RKP10237.1 hypothetical protein THASP1DRAFT_27965 [Thamnocephalis sphaerospora]
MAFSAPKPRSMPTGQRNVIRANDSPSLWNCTYSPGWSQDEAEVLRKAVMKFGIGSWARIVEAGCLPGKTIAQMNLQLQRLLGQQSTAEFAGLHLDPMIIGAINAEKQGPGIKRKNNCIVNTGNKPSREEIKRRIQQNRELYEVSEEEWRAIVLPKPEDPLVALEEKRQRLRRVKEELARVVAEIDEIRTRMENKENCGPTTPVGHGKAAELQPVQAMQFTKRVKLGQ